MSSQQQNEKTGSRKGQSPPGSLQAALWSYKLDALDLEADKELIIQQVLNYGTIEEVRWLRRTYSEEEIKEVVAHPRRGMWLPEVLTFWTTMYGIELDEETYGRALFKLDPHEIAKYPPPNAEE